MRLLALTPDLFFSTRILSACRQAGHEAQLVETEGELQSALGGKACALALLDIGAAGAWPWQALLHALREADPTLPVLAYGSHMAVEATREALTLGAVRVVAKSEFVSNFHSLIERYARPA